MPVNKLRLAQAIEPALNEQSLTLLYDALHGIVSSTSAYGPYWLWYQDQYRGRDPKEAYAVLKLLRDAVGVEIGR